MMRRIYGPMVVCVSSLLLGAAPAGATVVDWLYTLRVTGISEATGALVGSLSVGDEVSGHFRIDTARPPDRSEGGTFAVHDVFTTEVSVQIGSVSFRAEPGPPHEDLETFRIELWDGHEIPGMCLPGGGPCSPAIGPRDSFSFGIGRDLMSADGLAVDLGFELFEEGAGSLLLDGLDLPESLPFPLPPGVVARAGILLSKDGDFLTADADLVALSSQVPEPATLLLVAVAALALRPARRTAD